MPLLFLGLGGLLLSAIANGINASDERNKREQEAARYRAQLAELERLLAEARWRERVLRKTADAQDAKLRTCLEEILRLQTLHRATEMKMGLLHRPGA